MFRRPIAILHWRFRHSAGCIAEHFSAIVRSLVASMALAVLSHNGVGSSGVLLDQPWSTWCQAIPHQVGRQWADSHFWSRRVGLGWALRLLRRSLFPLISLAVLLLIGEAFCRSWRGI